MKAKKEDRNYIVQFYDMTPRKINCRLTDKLLLQSIKYLDKLINIYNIACKKNYSLTYLLDLSDDIESFIDRLEAQKEWAEDNYQYLQTHNDSIRELETYLTFEDLGYKWDMSLSRYRKNEWPQAYTKVIEDTNERSIEEEIWIFEDGEIKRRIRTTLWDTTDYGKSSRSITYKKKPLTKKIKLATANLLKYGGKKDEY